MGKIRKHVILKKIDFDNYKEKTAAKKENELDNKNTNVVKEKFNTFLSVLYDLYKKSTKMGVHYLFPTAFPHTDRLALHLIVKIHLE